MSDIQKDTVSNSLLKLLTKQTDFDGKFTYSNVVAVNIARTFNFSVKPNPVQNKLYISFTNIAETEMSINIYSSPEYSGANLSLTNKFPRKKAIIVDPVALRDEIAIELSAFQQGLYLIRISSEWDSYYEKVLKE